MEKNKQKIRYVYNSINRLICSEVKEKYSENIDLVIKNPFVEYSFDNQTGFCLVAISDKDDYHEPDQVLFMRESLFGLYTVSWEEIAQVSKYHTPDVNVLMNASFCYRKDLNYIHKFVYLNENLKKNMNDKENVDLWIGKHFIEILKSYDNLLKGLDYRVSFNCLFQIITRCEYIIFMLNRKVMPDSLKAIQEEILSMRILPGCFKESYENLVKSASLSDIKESCLRMIIKIKNLLDSLNISYQKTTSKENEGLEIKLPMCDDAKSGICYFMLYKLRENMITALQDNNPYLSFMSLAKCQLFYDEIHKKFNLPDVNLISQYNPNDLNWNVKIFERELKNWQLFYNQISKLPEHYLSVFELEDAYKIKLKK